MTTNKNRSFHAKFIDCPKCPVDDLGLPEYSFVYSRMKLVKSKEIVNVRFNLGRFWLPDLCAYVRNNSDKVFSVNGDVNKTGTVCVFHYGLASPDDSSHDEK